MNGIRNTSADQIPQGSFGVELRRLRTQQGLSLGQVADRTHYSRSHLNNVEHGVKAPSLELAAACDQALSAAGRLVELLPRGRPIGQADTLRPAQLPARAPRFVGRVQHLDHLDRVISEDSASRVVVIHGLAGVGKTALAVRWARRVRDRFPDGVLYADLHGHALTQPPTQPEAILEDFLRSLGITEIPPSCDGRAALFRSASDYRRMLLVLDDAASAAQIRPLLPGAPECFVMVTSRTRLSGLAVREAALQHALDPFIPDEAAALLSEILGEGHIGASREAANAVVRHCDYLPLAVSLAGERALAYPDRSLADLAGELAEERARLSLLAAADDDETAIRAAFFCSYQRLAAEPARMFRRLGLHAGSHLSVPAAAALAGIDSVQAQQLVETLATTHLIEETEPRRYRFHDLLRLYAAELALAEDTPEERDAALRRELVWYLKTTQAASRVLAPDNDNAVPMPRHETVPTPPPVGFASYQLALQWCETELANLVAAIRQAADTQHFDIAWQLALALFNYFHLTKPWSAWEDTYRMGLDAARHTANPFGEALMLHGLGLVCIGLRRCDEALDRFTQALAIQDGTGDRVGQAWSHTGRGMALGGLQQVDAAVDCFQQALAVHRGEGNSYSAAVVLLYLADLWRDQCQTGRALDCAQEALEIFRAIGNHHGSGWALHHLGNIHLADGRVDESLGHLCLALADRRAAGDENGVADTLCALAEASHRTGDAEAARESLQTALRIYHNRGDDPGAAAALRRLRQLDTTPDSPQT